VAPGNLYLGVMLPYTPLHHILLRDVGRPLVMTSGNLSEEPIAQSNDEARRRLGPLADAFLMHNRDIQARYDDSVVLVAQPSMSPSTQFLRRSRGYAPFPVRLPFKTGQILAAGADLKNAFCLTRDDFAFVSQHIGDMENLETLEHLEASVELFQHIFRVEPELIAHDLHPDYMATGYAKGQVGNGQVLVPIQHHQAHIASCLVDNGWSEDAGPVIGVSWDGTGYGLDGHIWGGEFLVGDYRGLERVAHLEYLPMPGGDSAIRSPWRLAVGYLYALTGEIPGLPGVSEQELRIARQQVDKGLNAPLSSAVGRLFDAVAALAGVRHHVSYEAQAAIELEMLATRWASKHQPEPSVYPYALEEDGDQLVFRLLDLLQAVHSDAMGGGDPGEIGFRFHQTLAEMVVAACERIAAGRALRTVALSGGCFQNRFLLSLTVPKLEEVGFQVLLHQQVPCNDGGISLGQAALAHFAAVEPARVS
jgi:hydrogenase maturation protein HypF